MTGEASAERMLSAEGMIHTDGSAIMVQEHLADAPFTFPTKDLHSGRMMKVIWPIRMLRG